MEIPLTQVKMFGMISTMLEALRLDTGSAGEGSSDPIPLANVSREVLQRILQWTEYHADEPDTSDDEDDFERRVDDVPQWDVDFIKQLVREDGTPGGDLSQLYELMTACNYLDVWLLLTFCCKFIARRLRHLTVEEARQHFRITNDYTPEEEERLRQENAWAEERRNP